VRHADCFAEIAALRARADAAEKEKQHAEQKIEELTDGRCWDLKGCAHEGFPKCPWCQRDAAATCERLKKALRGIAYATRRHTESLLAFVDRLRAQAAAALAAKP
jgi:prophage DNA circulation protein